MIFFKIFKNRNLPILFLVFGIFLACPVCAEGFELYVNNQSVVPGNTATIPVMIKNAEELAEVSFEISYDPSVLKFSGVNSGNISKNGIIEASETGPGTTLISFVESTGISHDGEIMKLLFEVPGSDGSSSVIQTTPKKILNLDKNVVPAEVGSATITVSGGVQKTPSSLWIPVLALIFIALAFTKRN
jgi:hypothetical protein